jgi:alcohol dehydrogenase
MRTRAAILDEVRSSGPSGLAGALRIADIDLDPPGPGEVLIRVAAAGLCHSDLSVINGDRPRPLPMALGHEASGVVQELGSGFQDLSIGDHVALTFMPSCGACLPCAEGRPALCEPGAAANTIGALLSGARRLSENGQPLHHHLGCSAFAEYAVVSRRSLVRIPRDLPLDVAALFGCAVLTGVGAIVNTAGVRPGQSVAIVGLGGVGLAAVLAAYAAGAAQVIAIDLLDEKLSRASNLGATHTISAADPDAASQVRDLTNGGCDHAVETAGAVQALALAFEVTRRGGTTVTAGLPPPASALSVNVVRLVAEERVLKGSYMGACVPTRDIPRYIALHQAGRLPVQKLLDRRIALDDINDAFDRLASGAAMRQVVMF